MNVFAYLDAGSGSMLIQAVLGGAAGLAVAFKAWRGKLATKRLASQPGLDATPKESRETANSD